MSSGAKAAYYIGGRETAENQQCNMILAAATKEYNGHGLDEV